MEGVALRDERLDPFVGAGVAYSKTQGGYDSLGAFSGAQNVTILNEGIEDLARSLIPYGRTGVIRSDGEVVATAKQDRVAGAETPTDGYGLLKLFASSSFDAAGATSVKDLGKVMGVVKARAAGRVDMSTVSARVRAMLTPE